MLIDIKPRIVKPPFGSVQIDWGHPLAPKAGWLLNEGGSGVYNSARPSGPATLGAGTTWETALQGPALKFDGTGNTTLQAHVNWAAPISIVLRIRITDVTVLKRVFNQSGALPTVRHVTGPNNMQFVGSVFLTGNLVLASNQWYTVGCVGTAAGHWLYMNGQQDATSATAYSLTGTAAPVLGADLDFFNGSIAFFYVYTRVISAMEMMWLHAEPYAFLRPVPAVRYYGPLVTPAGVGAAGPTFDHFYRNLRGWG